MLFGAQHEQQLLEFHQRLTIMEDKVEQMLQRHDVTDDVIVEIKSRLEDQGSLLHPVSYTHLTLPTTPYV